MGAKDRKGWDNVEATAQEIQLLAKVIITIAILKWLWSIIIKLIDGNDRKNYKRTQREKLMDSYYSAIRIILNKLRWKYKINYKNKENSPEGTDVFYNEEMMAELEKYNNALMMIDNPFLMIKFASITCDKIDKEMGRKKKKSWDKRPRDSHR